GRGQAVEGISDLQVFHILIEGGQVEAQTVVEPFASDPHFEDIQNFFVKGRNAPVGTRTGSQQRPVIDAAGTETPGIGAKDIEIVRDTVFQCQPAGNGAPFILVADDGIATVGNKGVVGYIGAANSGAHIQRRFAEGCLLF